jgi:hypothetical protein
MSSSKNWPGKELCGRCLSVWGLPIPPLLPPPTSVGDPWYFGTDPDADPDPWSVPMTKASVCGYSTLIHTGKGEGWRVEPERRGEGQQGRVQITKLSWKYPHDWMYARNWLSPVYILILINTCRKVPLQVNFFRWRYFSLTSMSLIFLRWKGVQWKSSKVSFLRLGRPSTPWTIVQFFFGQNWI